MTLLIQCQHRHLYTTLSPNNSLLSGCFRLFAISVGRFVSFFRPVTFPFEALHLASLQCKEVLCLHVDLSVLRAERVLALVLHFPLLNISKADSIVIRVSASPKFEG